MGPGKRNLVGFIIILLIVVFGTLIWGFFAQWPRSRWEAWRARRRQTKAMASKKNIPIVVVDPRKLKPCTSVLVLDSKYPADALCGGGSLRSASDMKGSGSTLSPASFQLSHKFYEDDGSSSILSADSHEKPSSPPELLTPPALHIPLKVKFSDPLIAVCSPPMR